MKKLTIAFLTILCSYTISMSQLYMDELGHLPYSNSLSDIWGHVDGEGNEYALVGVYNGLSIVSSQFHRIHGVSCQVTNYSSTTSAIRSKNV